MNIMEKLAEINETLRKEGKSLIVDLSAKLEG
jgi:hypothetical protein